MNIMSDETLQEQDKLTPSSPIPPSHAQNPDPPQSPDSAASGGRQVKASKLLDRVLFFRPNKALKDPVVGDQAARKKAESLECKMQPATQDEAREEKRRKSKERAQKYKDDKKLHRAEEKSAQDRYSSGVFWGFDPNAGQLRPGRKDDGPSVHRGIDRSLKPRHDPQFLVGRLIPGQTWGVQHGKPRSPDTSQDPLVRSDDIGQELDCNN